MSTEYLNNRIFEGIIARFQKSKKLKLRHEFLLEFLNETIVRKSIRKLDAEKENNLILEYNLSYTLSSQEFTEAQKKLATAFYTLSENIVRYAKFNFIDIDDAVQEGVMVCFDKMDRFVPKKGKAFNYFTTCILNQFRQLYRTARNYNELKRKYHDHLCIQMSSSLIKNGRDLPYGRAEKQNRYDF
jgi:DNA-directed RNA polymerase specialized sigma subunit